MLTFVVSFRPRNEIWNQPKITVLVLLALSRQSRVSGWPSQSHSGLGTKFETNKDNCACARKTTRQFPSVTSSRTSLTSLWLLLRTRLLRAWLLSACMAVAVAVRDSLCLLLFAASWLQTPLDCFATSAANPFKGERYNFETQKSVLSLYLVSSYM